MATTVSITEKSTTTTPANWAPIALDLIRTVRTLKAEYAAATELLQLTLGMLRTADKDRDRARENSATRAEHNRVLLAENKALKAETLRLRQQVMHTHNLPTSVTTSYTEAVQ
jgi:hypothetical protein